METTKSDEQIALLAIEEKSMFVLLIARYEEKLSRYLRRLGVHAKEDREDLLQNIFLKVYQNLRDFDTSLAFSSWIYRISHNEAVDFFRKKSVRPEGNLLENGEEILTLIPDGKNFLEELDVAINSKHLNKALLEMDQKYREIVMLRFFEGMEYEAISDILQIPIGSVGTLLHRARKELKKKLSHIAYE